MPDLEKSEPETFHEKMMALLQEWVQEEEDHPILLDTALVVWEQMWYGDDGKVYRNINYSTLTLNAGLASTAGLFDVGRGVLERDLFEDDEN